MILSPKFRLWFELLIFFGCVPLLILILKDRAVMLGALWLGGIGVWAWLKWKSGLSFQDSFLKEWNWDSAKSGIKSVLLRFTVIGPGIAAFTWIMHPDLLFSFPLERPQIWFTAMILYPLLSVVPQEMIYKSLFFGRYESLFPNGNIMIFISAFAFGYMHIILMSPIAIAMTFVAGLLISHSYAKTRSLALASFEHALYGCWAYTLGLGIYFYTGMAWGTH